MVKAGSAPAKTRDTLLDILKREGPQEVRRLAELLEISEIAVRQHLQGLEAEGLVQSERERRKVGRPVMLWALSENAGRLFPDAHADLTLDLIADMKALYGEEGMERLLERRSARQREAYLGAAVGEDLRDRLNALAEQRTKEGYMAEVHDGENGALLFVENNCPICSAARACSGLCAQELMVFRDVLGSDVEIERIDHILAGARRCAYRVSMRKGK